MLYEQSHRGRLQQQRRRRPEKRKRKKEQQEPAGALLSSLTILATIRQHRYKKIKILYALFLHCDDTKTTTATAEGLTQEAAPGKQFPIPYRIQMPSSRLPSNPRANTTSTLSLTLKASPAVHTCASLRLM